MTPQELFDANKGLVHHIARRYKVPEEDRDDMIQEGYLALWKAALGYDDSKGLFSTYAGSAIGHAYNRFTALAWNPSGLSACSETIRRAYNSTRESSEPAGYALLRQTTLSTEYKLKRDSEDDDDTIASRIGCTETYSDMYDEELRVQILDALDRITPEQRDLLVMRFGFDGHEPMTLREIGDAFGVSKATAAKRVSAAIKHLSNVASYSLRNYLTS